MRMFGLDRGVVRDDDVEELEENEAREEAEGLRECADRMWKVEGEREGG